MRLNQIKLAGFKSFVDPTSIATPGQLVGIVGPNGCGKSNVIDAVRWVLGESRASALRGESMQDVIFNGAGERAPVGRASVELFFDNSQGRIGGQWGTYGELSIKRVLTRDGDSTYYINNIPVRRRDIHDVFLGTGLGPRAYAIIEQGMISRVIEAKPEELRVFLEEAAGVSKYKERRRETEARLADTRENLARVEDIRLELGTQLEKLDAQAKVASEFRELEARLKQAQHLLWYSKQQDAVRARERHATELGNLSSAFEALQAELRGVENRLDSLRADHYAAGDQLHERQGAFYAANAEVTRLEQQLAFARESEGRLAQQVAQIEEQLAAIAAQIASTDEEQRSGEHELEAAIARREVATEEESAAGQAMAPQESRVAEAAEVVASVQQRITEIEQVIGVADARRESATKAMSALAQRRDRLETEERDLASRPSREIAAVGEQLEQEKKDLVEREKALTALNEVVHSLQESHRIASDTWQSASSALAEREARSQALSALQAKIGAAPDAAAWAAAHGLERSRRLWQQVDIERGWEDALEAVLREKLNALEVSSLESAAAWTEGKIDLPGRVAAYAAAPGDGQGEPRSDTLLGKVKTSRRNLTRVLADWLGSVRCVVDLDAALRARASLAEGEALVTPAGHVVSAQAISFFAPDSELHGVLARQREILELESAIAVAQEQTSAAASARTTAETELKTSQQQYHEEGLALSSQQRRCHELEIELVQLRQAIESAEHRRAQISTELGALAHEEATERETLAKIDAEIADGRQRLRSQAEELDGARHAADEAESALAAGRERVRATALAAQEAGFTERACRERLTELSRRREALQIQAAQQRGLLDQLSGERGQIDREPVEAALQAQLAARAEAEQALATARDRQEAIATELRTADEARLEATQKLDPARGKIDEMRLKEQAASLQEQQYAEQLAEVHADVAELPAQMKAWGRASGLPAEIERLTQTIAALGAVNLAALDELAQTSERKSYLDAQAQDLTEAMATLESAIRQIDRESRQLLQHTFDSVNVNFGRLFPTLFGGGQARLLLTGEEILDSGVQVIAQPPGKRNTSIHLLSGGEKSLTAIALVFALFQLNPAPFCMLDEVDAPLDDPNTERFCALVRTMTEATQFIFISHNKITMEMAGQLVGITMPDPGVSRVVAVDIAEALELAETAPQ